MKNNTTTYDYSDKFIPMGRKIDATEMPELNGKYGWTLRYSDNCPDAPKHAQCDLITVNAEDCEMCREWDVTATLEQIDEWLSAGYIYWIATI